MHTLFMAVTVVGTLGLVAGALADPITLPVALDRAAHRPSVDDARLNLDEARAHARGAALPLYNPEVSLGAGPQLGASSVGLRFQAGLQQTIERGGKRAARVRVADAEVQGAEVEQGAEVTRARVEAWRAFERALVLRDQVATRTLVETLARSLVASMQRGAAAGGVTTLRVNLVIADAGRATQERIAAESEYAMARAALATAVGAAASESLEPQGDVTVPSLASVETLVADALKSHPRLRRSESLLAVANAQVVGADARSSVDVTLGVGYAYEPDPDGAHSVVGTVSFPLAVRNRNEGERGAARIGVKRAELEQSYTRTQIERDVRLAAENVERSRAAVAAFDREVAERLNDNLTAAQDAFAKGGMDFVELTTTQRDLIASRVAYLDARLGLVDAWADLLLATGQEVTP